MIYAKLLCEDGSLISGGLELMQRWQEDADSRIWIDLDNEAEASELNVMAAFGCHELAIADARRERHPPKMQLFDDHLFLLLRGLDADSKDLDYGTLQIAIFAAPRFLVTRHIKRSVSINYWRKSHDVGAALAKGGVHLALEIAGTAARRYLDLLLEFEPRLDELEDQLQSHPDDSSMLELTLYKTRLRKLRRVFNYHSRVFENLRELESEALFASTPEFHYSVDAVYEKYERLLSLCSMFYELAGDLIDGYISLSSHQLNNTMRVLTVLTAIFVPLGFLAGLYGMNFDYMPELHWRGGYFILLSIMATIIVSLLVVFRRNRWL